MRSIFFIAVLTFTLNWVTFAQNVDSDGSAKKKSSRYVGLNLGVSKANMYGSNVDLHLSDPASYYETESGLEFGLTFKNEFTRFFYLKTGFSFIQKKGYVRQDRFVYGFNAELKFINIPIIVAIQPINFNNSKDVKLSFESGISFNIDNGSVDSFEKGLHPDNKVSRSNSIPGLLFGANLEILLTQKMVLAINYRYNRDLKYYFSRRYTWVNANGYNFKDYDVWIENNTIAIGILYKIP